MLIDQCVRYPTIVLQLVLNTWDFNDKLNWTVIITHRPSQDHTIKPSSSWVIDKPKEVPWAKNKRTMSQGPSEDTSDTAINQVKHTDACSIWAVKIFQCLQYIPNIVAQVAEISFFWMLAVLLKTGWGAWSGVEPLFLHIERNQFDVVQTSD